MDSVFFDGVAPATGSHSRRERISKQDFAQTALESGHYDLFMGIAQVLRLWKGSGARGTGGT